MTAPRPQTLPKAVQLSEMLIREIAAGRLADGVRLPPERIMASNHGVAVGTLRKALSMLETRGLLERVQGSGNYVRTQPVIESVYSFFRLERISGGGLPTADVLDVMRLTKPKEAQSIGPSRLAHRIRRLRYLDMIPVALEEIWLDERFAEHINSEDLNESLYHYYKESLGLVIARVEDRVGVAAVPNWPLTSFALEVGESAGFVERIGWSQNNQQAEYSRTWFDPSVTRYTSRM